MGRVDSSLCWFLLGAFGVVLRGRGPVGLFRSSLSLTPFQPPPLLSPLTPLIILPFLLTAFTFPLFFFCRCAWISSIPRLPSRLPLLARRGRRSAAGRSLAILLALPLFASFRLLGNYPTQEALCCRPCQHVLDCFYLSGIRLEKQRGGLGLDVKIQHIKTTGLWGNIAPRRSIQQNTTL